MSVPQELLDILACPLCRVAVRLTAAGDGLQCDNCGRVYPIKDDIPIMLPEEAVTVKKTAEPDNRDQL